MAVCVPEFPHNAFVTVSFCDRRPEDDQRVHGEAAHHGEERGGDWQFLQASKYKLRQGLRCTENGHSVLGSSKTAARKDAEILEPILCKWQGRCRGGSRPVRCKPEKLPFSRPVEVRPTHTSAHIGLTFVLCALYSMFHRW